MVHQARENEMSIPTGYSLKEFVAGYDRRNDRKFRDLSFSEIRSLIIKYDEIDPMVSSILQAAYAKKDKLSA